MRNLIVVESLEHWPKTAEGFEVVNAQAYLFQEEFQKAKNLRIYNLCASYSYQSFGYYVSLLAEARGHRPTPSVATLMEMKSKPAVRLASEGLDKEIQKQFAGLKSEGFELSIYFGQSLAKKYQPLADQLSRSFAAPMLRAKFTHKQRWNLTSVGPVGLTEVPQDHLPDLINFAQAYFNRRPGSKKTRTNRFSLAMLVNPQEKFPPSNERALNLFAQAGQELGLEVDRITAQDQAKLGEYDALFIRETTAVNHHTFRFALKAQALGLVVIDDPQSIIRCTNKVYLSELLSQHKIPTPKSQVLSKVDLLTHQVRIPFPCVLKQPDSSFSQGVVKVSGPEELKEKGLKLLEESDLIIAQEYMPTTFDWRVGIIGGMPLFVCRYHMAKGHWQIYKTTKGGKLLDGKVDVVAPEEAPYKLLSLAQKAAKLIGDGFYGLDIKEHDGKFYVIEINDNPSIEAGFEDQLLKRRLYSRIMEVFLDRLLLKVNS
ncbi:MAG: hypothetical protein A2600_09730 [Candidatus Lambdaproteobacteria bacterium RIFOXYD1_FULL_56_27]|uniref:ATP-grasp domain-containing protein n=1 Tax=Candidatus Lambdaproteobacteria bacterium RIFOXYD2_FULL_56_26 TaxID=1817773 RepID=A0A1F6GUV4_9PROT|nr:MAG: hypothetical protein A2557_05000 [Candidatus Lambdaproteobacteria bacterium RIFOXYD2_FULL_56_26]OGH02321.1 MAG: hypothetical protein A2426_03480 [Candidatus Lambdaproteobacteria bacterium RIFOXYC1_FULL_56_13]OGH10091.1 MAG: hypothetical protein A2600_09730 [Candidatus Lambdaproteobacteria bacterium RIFOXYD1_FULL_56_27]